MANLGIVAIVCDFLWVIPLVQMLIASIGPVLSSRKVKTNLIKTFPAARKGCKPFTSYFVSVHDKPGPCFGPKSHINNLSHS